jgi:hypothetical protein
VIATGWSLFDPPLDKPAELLGRKGLLYKEPATVAALCAVHTALGLPAGQRHHGPVDPRTAVVVSCNLGNVATVADAARAIATEGAGAVSVLAAPNASPNVAASTVAMWFGFGGPNLQVTAGESDAAVRLARTLLAADRADRVVLVGVEPADEVATSLYGPGLHAAAACVVLRAGENAQPGESPVPDTPAQAALPGYYGAAPVVALVRAIEERTQ